MAKKKKRAEKYDQKLHIDGSFEDVIRVSVSKAEKKEEEKPVQKQEKKEEEKPVQKKKK